MTPLWIIPAATLLLGGCAHRKTVSDSCFFDNNCKKPSKCKYVDNPTNPEFIHGRYVCERPVPEKAPEAK